MPNSTTAYQLEHPEDNQQQMVRAVTGVMLAVATVSMILRFVARKIKNIKPDWEDLIMLVGWAFYVLYCAFMFNVINKGFAKHTVYVTSVKDFTIALLCLEVTYNPSIICIKASILILYNRLFVQQSLKRFSWVLWAFVCAYSIVQFFGELFNCYPIASNWDASIPGRCIDLVTVVVTCSILNIVTDLIILSIPIPYLWQLQMSTTRKLQLSSIFLLGSFVCFVSIYRATLVHTVSHQDPAWSDVSGALWSGIELSVAIISGNLPVMRPIYNKVFRRDTSTDSASKSNGHGTAPLSSYPKLRPDDFGHETTITQDGFKRLGAGTDEASIEMEILRNKGMPMGTSGRILVKTEVEQHFD